MRKMTDLESIQFNIFIDKHNITNKKLYKFILNELFLSTNYSIQEFVIRFENNEL